MEDFYETSDMKEAAFLATVDEGVQFGHSVKKVRGRNITFFYFPNRDTQLEFLAEFGYDRTRRRFFGEAELNLANYLNNLSDIEDIAHNPEV